MRAKEEYEARKRHQQAEREAKEKAVLEKIATEARLATERIEADAARIVADVDARRWWFNQKNPIDRFTGWLVAWTALLFIATIANAAILYRTDDKIGKQAEIALKQLKEMHDQTVTTRAQIRANMASEGIDAHPVVGNGVLTGWEINPKWKNTGGTDAREYRGWYSIRFVEGAKMDATSCPKPPPFPANMQKEAVQPSHGLTQIAQFLSIIDVRRQQEHQGQIFIYGRIEYRDIFPDDPLHFIDWCILAYPNDPEHNVFSFLNMKILSD